MSRASSFLMPRLRHAGRAALDLILPPHCLSCGAEVEQAGHVCPDCFGSLHLIGRPSCRKCGGPFTSEAAAGTDRLCAECLQNPPPWDEGRAPLVYDEGSRRLILGLKYGDRTENAALLARYMYQAGRDVLDADTIVVPVPLHRWRLFRRRYNQSALLAHELARMGGCAHWPDALRRIRHTRPLGRLSRAERQEVLAGAITLRPHRASGVRGKHVVVVDDVMTTGSTLGTCVRVLRACGAARIDVLCAARVCPSGKGHP